MENKEKNNKKILIVSAHADDHISAAGTVFKLVEKGYEVYEVVLTDSSEGPDMRKSGEKQNKNDIAVLREQELSVASKYLGIKKTFQMKQEDLGLQYSKELMLVIAGIIRTVKPTIGIIMNPFDWHPDHRETFKIASEAFKWAATSVKPELGDDWRTPIVLSAEGMVPIAPNILVDITKQADKKMELWKIYDSQATSKSVKLEEGLMSVRGYHVRKKNCFFAEAFNTDPLSPILLFEDE